MAVLIKGMSFVPYNDEGFFNLRVSDGRPQAQYNDGYGKYTEWYDMIIVPEPHGRLIDADAIPYKKIMLDEDDDEFYYGVTQPYIDRMPTIIEAEGRE